MAYTPLTPLPGCCKVDSAYSNSIKGGYTNNGAAVGRYTDMLGARFIAGRPEKKGGWAPFITDILSGVCRGEKDWRDYSQNLYCGFGTNTKLYVYSNSITTLLDVTPLRSIDTGTLTNPVTTNGTTTVNITDVAHGLVTGDYVQLTATSAVDGVLVANTYFITKVDADNYTIVVPTAATGSTALAGGNTTYVYYRITVAGPVSTTNGSNVVTITQSNHGAIVGDTVIITGATAFHNITLSGAYVITSTTTNTYTIIAATTANATDTGGGGSPNFQYEISIGGVDAGTGSGYGISTYGTGTYGSSRSSSAFIVNPRIWSLDNYGQQLLANPYQGTIYIWDPSTYQNNNGRAYPMYGAPATVFAMFVTAERFVFALGATTNSLLVQWPDQNNYNDWTPTPTNTANSRTLQVGSYLVGGTAARDGTSLVGTDTCVYAFNYSGDTFIYDSTAAGRNSGLIAPNAMTSYASNAYWMSQDEFWTWNGSVQPLPSDDIRDYVFQNLNTAQSFKCFAQVNTQKKEVTFWYPVIGSNEISNSVTYHIDQQCWSIDTKSRTAATDNLLFPYPITTDADGNVWSEEYGSNANGEALNSYVVFNPMVVSKGDGRCDIMGFLPDFERQTGSLELTVLTQDYPEDTPVETGPFTLEAAGSTPLIDLRIGSTFVGYEIQSNVVDGDWRLGLPEVDIQVAGVRR